MSRRKGSNVNDAEDAELTEAQRVFVREYVYDFNATRAYRIAFPRCTYGACRVEACRLLTNPSVAKEIKAAKIEQAKLSGVSVKKVLRELAAIAFSDQQDYFEPDPDNGGKPKPRPFNEIPTAARKAIASIKIKSRRLCAGKDKTEWEIEDFEYKLYDKNAALDKFCTRLGIVKDGAAYDELVKLLASVAKENKPADDAGTGSKGKRS